VLVKTCLWNIFLRHLAYNIFNCLEADLLLDNEEEYIHPYSDEYVLLERKMRNRLSFFFMNPIEKWKTRRRFPYKFVIQIIKIILVTLQVSDEIQIFYYFYYNLKLFIYFFKAFIICSYSLQSCKLYMGK
jgi:hypothetical protein